MEKKKQPKMVNPVEQEVKLAAAEIAKLRQTERGGSPIERRSTFITDRIADGTFLKWKKAGVPFVYMLDSNGLKLDVGPEGKFGVHSHVPYEKISPELVAQMREQAFLRPETREHSFRVNTVFSERELTDLDARILQDETERNQLELEALVATHSGDTALLEKTVAEQETRLAHAAQNNNIYEDSSPRPTHKRQYLCNRLVERSWDVGRALRSGEHIPRATLNEYLQPSVPANEVTPKTPHYLHTDLGYRVMNLLAVAESLNHSWNEVDLMNWGSSSGWKKLRDSHDLSQVNKSVFDYRKKALHGEHNYETAKILDTFFCHFGEKDLAAVGVGAVRSSYADGLEFIGFWREHDYQHILIDPPKHIRNQAAKVAYESIPTIARSEFEAFEGIVLPFRYFRNLAIDLEIGLKQDTYEGEEYERSRKDFFNGQKPKLQNAMQGVLRIGITELSRADQKALHDAFEPLLNPNLTHEWSDEAVANARQEIMRVSAAYEDSFQNKSAREILNERVPMPNRRTVSFGNEFIKHMPQQLFDEPGARYNQELSSSGASVQVVESGPGGLHFAREAQAMRALGLERRPTIIVTGGSKHLDMEGADGGQAEKMAETILKVAIERRANVLIPGTQAGLGIVLAKSFQNYISTLSAEEKINAPHFFAIEPGKELYYSGNPILDTSPGASVYPMTVVDTVVTPYHAGWGTHGSESEYRHHVHYRQAFVTRASAGFPAVVVTGNGGKWTIMEDNYALGDAFPVIPVNDTGRFATLLSSLMESRDEWKEIEGDVELISYIEKTMTAALQPEEMASVHKDLQDPLYVKELLKFIRAADPKLVSPVSTAGLEAELSRRLSIEV